LSGPSGLYSSLRSFAATSVALLRTRFELLKVEAQDGSPAVVSGLVRVGHRGGACSEWSGLVFLAVFLTVLLWDSHRLLALGVFAALFLGAAAVAIGVALQLARRGSQLFAASLAELRRDEAALREERQP